MSGALRLIDGAGEVLGDADAYVESLEQQVKDLQAELTRKLGVITKLKRDKVAWRREHPLRPVVVSIWAEWQVECNHPRSGLTDDRFDAVLALLETRQVDGKGENGACLGCGERVYDRAHFSRAIAGAKFDPFITTNKAGRKQRHDDLALICEGGKKFESFCNRAPRGWQPPAEYPAAPPVAVVES